jgi:hypothetical protein
MRPARGLAEGLRNRPPGTLRRRDRLQPPAHLELARVISEIFTDVIIAPEFEADARAFSRKRKTCAS